MFAATLTGLLMAGLSVDEAVKEAVSIVTSTILATAKTDTKRHLGLNASAAVSELIKFQESYLCGGLQSEYE